MPVIVGKYCIVMYRTYTEVSRFGQPQQSDVVGQRLWAVAWVSGHCLDRHIL